MVSTTTFPAEQWEEVSPAHSFQFYVLEEEVFGILQGLDGQGPGRICVISQEQGGDRQLVTLAFALADFVKHRATAPDATDLRLVEVLESEGRVVKDDILHAAAAKGCVWLGLPFPFQGGRMSATRLGAFTRLRNRQTGAMVVLEDTERLFRRVKAALNRLLVYKTAIDGREFNTPRMSERYAAACRAGEVVSCAGPGSRVEPAGRRPAAKPARE
jgi:hypothetical protein